MTVLAMLVALGVVISPILRVEGMCPMAHFINITCSVLLGPWYSLLCAVLIGILRMTFMGIPPLALTGAVFGAFLSGVLYRVSGGRMIYAVLGEIIGTGIIGAVVSYPVMAGLMGRTGLSWLFYVPSFICGTLIGGSAGASGKSGGRFYGYCSRRDPGIRGSVRSDEEFHASDRRADHRHSGSGVSAGRACGSSIFCPQRTA